MRSSGRGARADRSGGRLCRLGEDLRDPGFEALATAASKACSICTQRHTAASAVPRSPSDGIEYGFFDANLRATARSPSSAQARRADRR